MQLFLLPLVLVFVVFLDQSINLIIDMICSMRMFVDKMEDSRWKYYMFSIQFILLINFIGYLDFGERCADKILQILFLKKKNSLPQNTYRQQDYTDCNHYNDYDRYRSNQRTNHFNDRDYHQLFYCTIACLFYYYFEHSLSFIITSSIL